MRSARVLARSPRARGLLAISGGSAAGQVLAVAAVPLLARIYSPADFGVYTVVAAITLTLAAVAPLRFDLAIPLPDTQQDAYSLVTLGLGATLLTALLGTLGVALASGPVARFFEPGLTSWLWAAPWIAAAIGTSMVFSQLAVRDRRYGAIGRRNALQSTVLIGTQLIAGAAGLRPGGLVAGFALGQIAGTLSLLRSAGYGRAEAREGRKPRRVAAVLKRYRRFPLILAPSGLINVVGMQLPVLFIASFYGGEVAGWLGLTQRVLALPVTLIGAATAQVYLGELSSLLRAAPEQARALFTTASKRLALVGVVVAVALWAAGPPLFSLVFGAEWLMSGHYAQGLALGLAAQLLAAPLSQTLIAFERQLAQFTWDLSRLVVVSGATVLTAVLDQPAGTAVWVFGTASGVAYLASWLMSRHVVGRAERMA